MVMPRCRLTVPVRGGGESPARERVGQTPVIPLLIFTLLFIGLISSRDAFNDGEVERWLFSSRTSSRGVSDFKTASSHVGNVDLILVGP